MLGDEGCAQAQERARRERKVWARTVRRHAARTARVCWRIGHVAVAGPAHVDGATRHEAHQKAGQTTNNRQEAAATPGSSQAAAASPTQAAEPAGTKGQEPGAAASPEVDQGAAAEAHQTAAQLKSEQEAAAPPGSGQVAAAPQPQAAGPVAAGGDETYKTRQSGTIPPAVARSVICPVKGIYKSDAADNAAKAALKAHHSKELDPNTLYQKKVKENLNRKVDKIFKALKEENYQLGLKDLTDLSLKHSLVNMEAY